MTHDTCRLTAQNRDQLRNPTLGNRVWAAFLQFDYGGAARRCAASRGVVLRCGTGAGSDVDDTITRSIDISRHTLL